MKTQAWLDFVKQIVQGLWNKLHNLEDSKLQAVSKKKSIGTH